MSLEQEVLAIVQLVLAAVFSGLIGMDRERRDKSAGFRTHMLAGIGACLFTILSLQAFPEADTSRVAASVVSGIGFLGAGVIVKRGGTTHDLTTAASVWSTAAVGMAVGAGAYVLAAGGTVVIWVVLEIVRRFSKDDDAKSNEAHTVK
ncbi:MgtC/SapB family protein [Phototrophicus methaneseepsis]|uniref:MgtC/SapB family protein n=2 Tax=Phototrophicus methaneseepsis TaxID=2710758 RepID=A0A7S8EDY2_9CHLR|nr:MgtC/SapB family protein [Phototrophicus methaneseepsis]